MLAILTTHPIQYQTPLWQALAKEGSIPFEVWYLSDHGTKQSYDTQFGQAFAWDIDTLSGYPHCFLPMNDNAQVNSFIQMRLSESFAKRCKNKGVKVLWVQGWQVLAYWQAVFQAHHHGIPVWLRGESNDLRHSHSPKEFTKSFVLKQLFRRVSYFFYIGSANRRLYQHHGIQEHQLVNAPYAVDNIRFAQAAQQLEGDCTSLRKLWNIPEQAFCFLFCGKLIAKKRPFDLLEAAARLIAENPALGTEGRIHILVVGNGELSEMLHLKAQQIQDQCGRSLISFVGFLNQTEIPQAYVAADCLVLPSDAGETWGLVVNEALACGRPAIVSNLCGCAEDLAKPLGETFVYPCGNVAELANRLKALIDRQIHLPNKEIFYSLLQKHSLYTVVTNVIETYLRSV